MKAASAALAAAGLVLTTSLLVAAPHPPKPPRYVLTDREGFVLQDPLLVAPAPVHAAEWSRDGRYVLAVRQAPPSARDQPPSSEVSLVLWTHRTGVSRELWKRPPGLQMVDQIHWLSGAPVALVVYNWVQPVGEQWEPRQTLLRVDAARAQVKALAELQNDRLLVSPSQPLAVLVADRETPSLRVLRSDGSITAPVQLPRMFHASRWSADGSLLYAQSFERPAAPGQRVVEQWDVVDLRAGTVRPLAAPPPDEAAPTPLPQRLKRPAVTLKEEGTTQRVHPVWLESTTKSEQPRALVTADCEWATLAPNAGAVLYQSHGAAWAMPLARLPREQALAQHRAVYQAEAVSRAKQIGLAFSMYAQDYDQVFPPAGEKITDIVLPYVKNPEVFVAPGQDSGRFLYMLDASPLATIKDPSTTILGYLPAPGGRAVIYVDGHVKWEAD
jgi:hypothetical protein